MNSATAVEAPQDHAAPAAPAPANPDIPRSLATEHIDRLCALAAALLDVRFVTVVRGVDGGLARQDCWIHGRAESPAQLDALHAVSARVLPGGIPILVDNIPESPVFGPLFAVGAASLIAYAGVPLTLATGEVIGRLCAVDVVPRRWTEREVSVLTTVCSLIALSIKLHDAACEKRRADAAAEQREAQGELIAEIAHDLRQPLALISLSGELLVRDGPERRHQHGDMLRKAVGTMKTMIEDLLDREPAVARDAQPVDPAALVDGVVRELAPLAAERGLLVEGAAEAGLPAVYCDPAKIQRVYSNLMGNAMKFAAPATTIRLATARVQDGVQFSVTNDGHGIAAADAVHVFERQWQASHDGEGRGLGLAIVRRIIESQGGSIGVRSAAGTTSFCFTLPVRSPAPRGPAAVGAP